MLIELPEISRVAVYPVPDESVSDQVMAAVVLRDGASLHRRIRWFLARQPDLSPRKWPRYVWIAEDLPSTATNKILKQELVSYGTTPQGGLLWGVPGQRYGSVISRSTTTAPNAFRHERALPDVRANPPQPVLSAIP